MGRKTAFLRVAAALMVGWFLVLMAIAITGFEAISLAWFLDRLFPGRQGPVAYRVLGADIRVGGLLIGVVGVITIAAANYWGVRVSGRLQEIFTYAKAVAVVLFVAAAAIGGHASPTAPLWPQGSGIDRGLGVGWIAATAPLWLAGFQVVPQVIEERSLSIPLSTVGRFTVLSVILGVIFYAAVVLASTRAVAWPRLLHAPLPAMLAVETAIPRPSIARAVLLAVILGILATWNSAFLWATRLLLALGRARLLPAAFAQIGHHQSPTVSVLIVGALGLFAVFVGRAALLPIVGMASMSLAMSYALTCAAALRQRRLQPDRPRPFRVAGGKLTMRIALVASSLMAVYGLLEPWLRARTLPAEWILLAAWWLAGVALLYHTRRRRMRS